MTPADFVGFAGGLAAILAAAIVGLPDKSGPNLDERRAAERVSHIEESFYPGADVPLTESVGTWGK